MIYIREEVVSNSFSIKTSSREEFNAITECLKYMNVNYGYTEDKEVFLNYNKPKAIEYSFADVIDYGRSQIIEPKIDGIFWDDNEDSIVHGRLIIIDTRNGRLTYYRESENGYTSIHTHFSHDKQNMRKHLRYYLKPAYSKKWDEVSKEWAYLCINNDEIRKLENEASINFPATTYGRIYSIMVEEI